MSIDKLMAVSPDNSKEAPQAIAAAIDKQLFAVSRILAKSGVDSTM